MNDFNQYNPPQPQPRKEDFTTYFVYQRGTVLFKGTKSEYGAFFNTARLDSNPITTEASVDEEALKQAREKWHTENRRRLTEFKVDALEEVGLTNHSKAEQAFEFAMGRCDYNKREAFELLEELAILML